MKIWTEHTHTHASRAPIFLLITIISASPSSGASSAPSATQKSDASRAASPPDRQKRGDSEVLLEEKKKEAPEGAPILDVAGEFKVICAIVMVSIDVYRPITSLVYLEVVHISYAARYSGLKVVFFFGVTLMTAIP